jgi:CheY-like chemotaxis protein
MSKRTGPEELRILIVDDSETACGVVGTILRSRHWTICGEAENGRTGIEKCQKLKSFLAEVEHCRTVGRSIVFTDCRSPTSPVTRLQGLRPVGYESPTIRPEPIFDFP